MSLHVTESNIDSSGEGSGLILHDLDTLLIQLPLHHGRRGSQAKSGGGGRRTGGSSGSVVRCIPWRPSRSIRVARRYVLVLLCVTVICLHPFNATKKKKEKKWEKDQYLDDPWYRHRVQGSPDE